MITLGRLERLPVRDVWQNEATHFTPWLEREENLGLLGDAIGMDLEVAAREKGVGPYRADLLCKDTVTGHWVLVENQLERTDHTHLGQLVTYAAGLNAVTIVWIAETFTEEHRAALDWLNEVTTEDVNFFGLEIELWRIGDSSVAPKFNIKSQPNDWTKTLVASRSATGEVTETKSAQQEYWTALREVLLSRDTPVTPQKPHPQHWADYAIGRSHFHLSASMHTLENWIAVSLILGGPDAKAHFFLLRDRAAEIETAVGTQLEWEELPTKKSCRITVIRRNTEPLRVDTWSEQHQWLADMLTRLHKVLAPLVRDLDAAMYSAPEEITETQA